MGKHTRWKMTRGESLSHKLAKPQTIRKFNRVEKLSLLGIVLIALAFTSSFTYYSFYVAPLSGSQAGDPWTTLFNGQSPGIGTATRSTTNIDSGACLNTQTSAAFAVIAGDTLLVTIREQPSSGANSVSDSSGNVYTSRVDIQAVSADVQVRLHVYSGAIAIDNAALTYTVTLASAGQCGISATDFIGITGIGNLQTATSLTPGTSGSSPLSLVTSDNSVVYEALAFQNGSGGACDTLTFGSSQTLLHDFTCFNGVFTSYNGKVGYTKTGSAGTNNYAISWNGGNCANFCGMAHFALELTASPVTCLPGYQCYNATGNTNGDLVLTSVTNQTSVILTKSAIDLSVAVTKNLGFYETINSFEAGNYVTGLGFGWFVTTNGTLPQVPGYNPLNDTNVVLAVLAYPVSTSTYKWNVYVYMSKNGHESLVGSSGLGFNPYPKCPQSSTLYLCGQSDMGAGTSFEPLTLSLNFTGAGQSSTSAKGLSKICVGVASGRTCENGGAGGTSAAFNVKDDFNTTTLPFFSPTGRYNLGFWREKGQSQQTFGNRILIPASPNTEMANVISMFVPGTCTLGLIGNCTNPLPDTGSYFSWALSGVVQGLCRAPTLGLVNVCDVVGNAVQGAKDTFFKNVYDALVTFFTTLAAAYKFILNGFGNLVGLGNIGDVIFAALATIGSLIVQGFSAIVGFFTAIGSLIVSGYFTFIAGAAVLIGTLIPAAVFLWGLIFNAAYTVTDVLFFDYVMGMAMVLKAMNDKRSCLKAFLAWIALNVFLFTFIFNAAWAIFDIVTRPIHRTKQTVSPLG